MQPSQQSDIELVVRIQGGDAAAFDEFMQRYKHPVLNFVHRMLGDAVEAEDVAQEVFVHAYQRLGAFEIRSTEAKVSTWLFTLARNAVIDRLRWRQRHPAGSLESAPESSLSTTTDAASEASAHEIGRHIADAVAALPEDQRTALVLAEYQGLAYAEIAQVMKCSEKSIESRLYRAKQTLRKRLGFLLEE
jgi:RNA polymerase sigma-70 factor (ECF subfamily)